MFTGKEGLASLELIKNCDGHECGTQIELADEKLQNIVFELQTFAHVNSIFSKWRHDLLFLQNSALELMEKASELKMAIDNGGVENSTEKNDAMDDETRDTVEVRVTFGKVTPKADKSLKHLCSECGNSYTAHKSLKRHIRKMHPEITVPEDSGDEYVVTCKMCKKKSKMDLLGRHLKQCHQEAKPNPDYNFRGYLSIDDAKTWRPLWLARSQHDPVSDSMQEVPVINGYITVFGVKFKLETDQIDEMKDSGDLLRLTDEDAEAIEVKCEAYVNPEGEDILTEQVTETVVSADLKDTESNSWTTEKYMEDSDFEDGDDPEFSNFRIEMKKIR